MGFLFIDYIVWHFLVAPKDIAGIAGNYMKSSWVAFLIPTHLRTLFSPWHRRDPSQLVNKSDNFGERIVSAIADFYIRLIAAFVRLTVVVVGLVWELLLAVFFFSLILVWLMWPVLAILIFLKGLFLVYPIL